MRGDRDETETQVEAEQRRDESRAETEQRRKRSRDEAPHRREVEAAQKRKPAEFRAMNVKRTRAGTRWEERSYIVARKCAW